MESNNKIIICAALTGAITPKEKSPHHPITPDEISEDVVRCARAGASVVHLHGRNPRSYTLSGDAGQDIAAAGTMDPVVYVEIIDKVKEACVKANVDVVINITTSGGPWTDINERINHIKATRPEMMSYDIGSFNWDDSFIYNNPPEFLRMAGKIALDLDVKPEIEVFDSGHIISSRTYIKEDILKTPCHYAFIMGVGGAAQGTPEDIMYLKRLLPEGSTWFASGIGKMHIPVIYAALAAGCTGLRVGLEDNIYFSRGVKATNLQLVERAVHLATVYGREIATADEARKILGITRKSW